MTQEEMAVPNNLAFRAMAMNLPIGHECIVTRENDADIFVLRIRSPDSTWTYSFYSENVAMKIAEKWVRKHQHVNGDA